jgi:hypothetical protein
MTATSLLQLRPMVPPPTPKPPSVDERTRHFNALLSQMQSEARLQALWQEHARIDRQRAVECDERDAEVELPVHCEGWPSWGERFRQSASAHELQAAEAGRRVEVAKSELRRMAGLS